MQLMPATAVEVGVRDPFNPQDCLRGGIAYLRKQYERLPEIPEPLDRYLWSLAAYNCGLGYVNRALKLARQDEEPLWWKWTPGRYWLMSRECIVAGRWPLFRQSWGYVARIQSRFVKEGTD
jgi:membrane-bound lytic murein transglycosylase MltF